MGAVLTGLAGGEDGEGSDRGIGGRGGGGGGGSGSGSGSGVGQAPMSVENTANPTRGSGPEDGECTADVEVDEEEEEETADNTGTENGCTMRQTSPERGYMGIECTCTFRSNQQTANNVHAAKQMNSKKRGRKKLRLSYASQRQRHL
jgi:hypothetical protein